MLAPKLGCECPCRRTITEGHAPGRGENTVPYTSLSQPAEQSCWLDKIRPKGPGPPGVPSSPLDIGRTQATRGTKRRCRTCRADERTHAHPTARPRPCCEVDATPARGHLSHLGPVAFFENMTWTRGPFWKLEHAKWMAGQLPATGNGLPGAGDAVPQAQTRRGESRRCI